MATEMIRRARDGFSPGLGSRPVRPRNLCCACGQDFNSVDVFDRHRVGVHAYSYSEGAQMEPPREDGRRCLSVAEMAERGWQPTGDGRWFDPVSAARARLAFAPTSERA
jgi:hypothetical protein